jgi:hypothetical protein
MYKKLMSGLEIDFIYIKFYFILFYFLINVDV